MESQLLELARACKGFLDESEGMRLYDAARECGKLGPALEIGSYCGKSSIYLGAGAKVSGTTLICVDHHRGSEEHQKGRDFHDPELFDSESGTIDTLSELRRNLRLAELEDVAVIFVTKSTTAARLWRVPLGLVFIDGGHSTEAACADYEGWHDKISPGGILAIHDLHPEIAGMGPHVAYARALASGLFEALPQVKSLGVLRRRA